MSDASRRTIARRTVVRTAVVTAWTVPVVQVVAAAPAMARCVSGGPNLGGTTGEVKRSADEFNISATITNTGSATSTIGATISWTPADKSTLVSATGPAGWTKTGAASWSTSTPLAAGKSTVVSLWAKTSAGKATTGTITVSFSPACGTSGGLSATFK